jgi:hypothetical protein
MAATHPVMEMEHSDTLMGHAVTTMQVVGDTLNSARDILATYSALNQRTATGRRTAKGR